MLGSVEVIVVDTFGKRDDLFQMLMGLSNKSLQIGIPSRLGIYHPCSTNDSDHQHLSVLSNIQLL